MHYTSELFHYTVLGTIFSCLTATVWFNHDADSIAGFGNVHSADTLQLYM